MADLAFTAEAVQGWAKIEPRAGETDVLPTIVSAVSAWIDGLPNAPRDDAGDWTDGTILAAIMFAARLYRRRNSPNGIEAFGESGALYVARYDPDVARLLRLDAPSCG